MIPRVQRPAAAARALLALAAALAAGWAGAAPAQDDAAVPARHAMAMHGEPALPADFRHLPYADPSAPKGGRVTYAVQGTFDTLNPFIVRGTAASGLSGAVFEPLMARSYDEPFTLYGLVAQTVRLPEDRTWVEFAVDPRAKFSDGQPVTARDVLFSWSLLRERGRPNHRTYYAKVTAAEALDERTVRFELGDGSDRELPLILGLMPVLPQHAIDPETFESSGFATPVGSGPYEVAEVRRGDGIVLRRDPDYWGADLPVSRGMWNFDEVRDDDFRDANTMFEAFKGGLYDVRPEGDPGRWATGYDFPAAQRGEVLAEAFDKSVPSGMNGFVFNTRRPAFSDARVREALGMLLDFEWVNANLFHGLYSRTGSYFDNSELSARGRPASEAERALLSAHSGAVRADILEGEWQPPASDGSGRDRTLLRRALVLLREAGWRLSDGALVHGETGEPMAFEILVRTKEQERISLAYSAALERAGIRATVRLVDAIQFDRRIADFQFDMTVYFWFASLSPGNEQAFYWGSAAADTPGTRNYMGAKEPAVDAMIQAILAATTRDELVAAVRSLDRVLLSGFYVVPLYHAPQQWMARWSHIGRPEATPIFGPIVESWWRQEPRS